MDSPREGRTTISAARIMGLFTLFFVMAWGLGYPILNRYDPRQTPGLTDVKSYAAVETGAANPDDGYRQFRVLVPSLGKPFYLLAKGRSGSWDPAMFGLLVADSLFVAGTALLIAVIGVRHLASNPVACLASLLYLTNFAVPNLRLVGLVDAGEGFFLLALIWSLLEPRLWMLLPISVFGTLTKESFIPLSITFMAAWWCVIRKQLDSPARSALWIAGSWVASVASMDAVHWCVAGRFMSPAELAASMRGDGEFLSHVVSSFWDRTLLYVFVWLLPMGIPCLGRFPKSWLIPTGAASAMVFALDVYHGGPPGGVARTLFSMAGPLLSLSAAAFLLGEKELFPPNSSA